MISVVIPLLSLVVSTDPVRSPFQRYQRDSLLSIIYEYRYEMDTYPDPGKPGYEVGFKSAERVNPDKDQASIFIPGQNLKLDSALKPLCGCDGVVEDYSVKLLFPADDTLYLQFNLCDSGFKTAYTTIRDSEYRIKLSAIAAQVVKRKFQILHQRMRTLRNKKGCT